MSSMNEVPPSPPQPGSGGSDAMALAVGPVLAPIINPIPPCTIMYTCIVPDGDLNLEVGNGEAAKRFVVCSKMLARTSPSWKNLLRESYAESQQPTPHDLGTEWVVKLPDDNPESMELLLNIIHGRFELVPESGSSMTLTKLYQLCVTTDKYGMTRVLRPWANGWWRSLSSYVEAQQGWPDLNYGVEDLHRRLWVSWELGDDFTFMRIARTLVLNYSRAPSPEIARPPGIYENIEQLRVQTVENLLDIPRGFLSSLHDPSILRCSDPKEHGGNCVSLGAFLVKTTLYKSRTWPIPDIEEVIINVTMLAQAVKEIDAEGMECCRAWLDNIGALVDVTVARAESGVFTLLTAEHRRHLAEQKKKSAIVTDLVY